MKEQNGIQIFDPDEDLPLPPGLPDFPNCKSPYGFKVDDINGKLDWTLASEEDYRASEAQRLGIGLDAVQAGPCFADYHGCGGRCPSGFCVKVWNQQQQYWYCTCP